MRCRLQTELTNEEINERTEHVNSKYKIKLQKSIKVFKKIPSIMMMGKEVKEGRIAVLEAMEASTIPIIVENIEPHWVTLIIDDIIFAGVNDSRVMGALSKVKGMGSNKEMMLKELMDTYQAKAGQWLEEPKKEEKTNVNEDKTTTKAD